MTNGYVVDEARLLRLEEAIGDARRFAQEARDSSRANNQTLAEVVTPRLKLVDKHESIQQRMLGAMWILGILWTCLLGAVAIYASRKP